MVTRQRLEAAHRRIDQRRRPAYPEFHLICVLTNLGVALRRIGAVDLLSDLLPDADLPDPAHRTLRRPPRLVVPYQPYWDKLGAAGGRSTHGMAMEWPGILSCWS
ncbi:hypothetical protein [Actinomadura sp. NPDC000600]|uniref:hypothetical protein n=1 Tax=Actinomadura sp. NPDC000600 TaxID=3154262 RepID=UPI00339AC7E7